jgi:hypothetical protein
MPSAQIKLSINGGALVEGGQTVSGGDTIDLSAESTVGWKMSPAPEWRLYGFYSDYTAPAGWSTRSITQSDGTTISVYYYLGVTPPQITVQGASWWGKVNIGLYVDGGTYTDESAGFEVVSPTGLHDLSYREASQFGAGQKWTLDWRANIRTLDTLAASLSGSFADNAFEITDNVDPTKIAQFQASSIPTATTVVLTLPAASGRLLTDSELLDNVFRVSDNADPTKKVALDLGGLSTATTRTLTIQDANGTVAYLSDLLGPAVVEQPEV